MTRVSNVHLLQGCYSLTRYCQFVTKQSCLPAMGSDSAIRIVFPSLRISQFKAKGMGTRLYGCEASLEANRRPAYTYGGSRVDCRREGRIPPRAGIV